VPAVLLAAMAVHAQQPPTPVFRSSVEVTSIGVPSMVSRPDTVPIWS